MRPFQAVATFVIVASFLATLTAHADEPQRQISVTGKAVVTARPDIARIGMTVVERNASLKAAQQSVATSVARLLDTFDDLGIRRHRIDTSGLNIRPDYRWNRATEEQELIGYVVERRINVELRDLDKLGPLLERAVQAGANQVTPPQFDSSRRDELQREALAAAVRDARANADVMAAAAGAAVGPVISIAGGGMPPRPQPMMRAMAADAVAESAEASYVAGDIRFEASVSIVYDLAS